ncbi:MAG: M56 family metallopeptidase, partial [Planctomycetota bacterium]|nr:M56 family metallopeptidase [Planctomycetota bacterium]
MTGLENLLTNPFIQRVGWALLHFLWQGAAVAVILAGAMLLLRHKSSNLRYAAACAAMALMLLLPAGTMWMVRPSGLETIVTPDTSVAIAPVENVEPAAVPLNYAVDNIALPAPVEVSFEPAAAAKPVEFAESIDQPLPWYQQIGDAARPALPWGVCCWLIGVLVLSMWRLRGWVQVRRLTRRSIKPTAQAVRDVLAVLSRRLGIGRAVRAVESAMVRVPTVIGWLKPVILLPVSALTGLTAEQLEAVLAHELAHIRRNDYLVNLLQTAAETLLFYHPAVWWVSHRIRAERENCCDDLAVAACGRPVVYARALAAVAKLSMPQPHLAVAADGGKLFNRIRRIVGLPNDQTNRRGAWLAGAFALLTVLAITIALGVACATDKTPAASNNDEPPATQPGEESAQALNERIAHLIIQLAGSKYKQREEAQKALVQIGLPAVAPLKEAAGDKDPERSMRARSAIRQIELTWPTSRPHTIEQREGIPVFVEARRLPALPRRPSQINDKAAPQGKWLKAGTARIDITPARLGRFGYPSRQATGIHDHLYVRAVVLDNGEDKMAIISCDRITGVSFAKTAEIRNSISERTGIPPDNVLISITTTHSGCNGPEFIAASVDAAVRAWENRKNARIGVGSKMIYGIGANRRLPDGTGLWESNQPNPKGVMDNECGVIRIEDEKRNIIAVVVNYASFPTVLWKENTLVSGDYCGIGMLEIEKRLGKNAVALFLQGCAGDVGTQAFRKSRTMPEAERLGQKLADEAMGIIKNIDVTRWIRLAGKKRMITLPRQGWGFPISDEIQALAIGDSIILSLGPVSPYVEIGLNIKDVSPFKHTFVLGYSNGPWLGYVPSEHGYVINDPDAQTTRFGPATPKVLVIESHRLALEMIAKVKKPTPPATQPGEKSRDIAIVAELALRFLKAMREDDIDTLKGLSAGAEQGWLEVSWKKSDRMANLGFKYEPPVGWSVMALKDVASEVRTDVFARNPDAAGKVIETAIQGDYAATRSPFINKSAYLVLVFVRTPQGWRFATLDDGRISLEKELAKHMDNIPKNLKILRQLSNPATQPAGQTGENTRLRKNLISWVEKFFSQNYRDVKNRETIEWGQPKKLADGNYSI